MDENNIKELRNILRGKTIFGSDYLFIMNSLNEFYTNNEFKQDIVNYIEYTYLPDTKIGIKTFSEPNMVTRLYTEKINILENWIKEKKVELLEPKEINKIADFSEYILITDTSIKAEFLKELKAKYLINKASKDYALMILALKELKKINFKKRNQKNVYSALKSFLDNTDIGTDSALNKTILEFENNRNNILENNKKNTTHIIDTALKELNPHIETIETILNNLNKTE